MENITIKGNLTPGFMNEKLGPFLDSIQNIQHIFDEIKQVPPSPVKINEISWEGVDTIENDVWADTPKVTIFLNQAKKALAGLRETLDYLNEEPSNQSIHFASVRLAQSLFEALSLSIEPDVENFLETRYIFQQYSKISRTLLQDTTPKHRLVDLLDAQNEIIKFNETIKFTPLLAANWIKSEKGDDDK